MLRKHMPGVLETKARIYRRPPNDLVLMHYGDGNRDGFLRLLTAYTAEQGPSLQEENTDQIRSWLTDPTSGISAILASQGGSLTGFIIYENEANPLAGTYHGRIHAIYVEPQARRQRVGSALVLELTKMAELAEWRSLGWVVADKNYQARLFFDQFGDNTTQNVYLQTNWQSWRRQ